jgi:glycosyltransferase involved in cell wall biosynthesis
MKILLPINIDRWRSPIATLLRACVEHNPEIKFFSFSRPETEEDVLQGECFWSLDNVNRISNSGILSHSFDIIHIASHTYKNLLAGTLAKLRSVGDTKFLYTINLEVNPLYNNDFIYRWFSAIVDEYVSVSQIAGKLVRQEFPNNYHGVIPNGYDPDYFSPTICAQNDLPEKIQKLHGAPYVLNVAALEPRKHPEWIVRLARQNPDLTFVMAGWIVPGLGDSFYQEIETCQLPNLIWLGHVNRSVIRALLRHASAFAFPSEREGLPLSVIEAMGMGVPVVAQPKSSLPELITAPYCGCLIDIDREDSLQQWSHALRSYVSMDDAQRMEFRRILSTDTKSRFSWESIGRSYASLYGKIMTGTTH